MGALCLELQPLPGLSQVQRGALERRNHSFTSAGAFLLRYRFFLNVYLNCLHGFFFLTLLADLFCSVNSLCRLEETSLSLAGWLVEQTLSPFWSLDDFTPGGCFQNRLRCLFTPPPAASSSIPTWLHPAEEEVSP